VYFFRCDDGSSTPFDLLPDSKILTWTEGLAHGLYLGRTAKSAGRNRYRRFQEALQAAVIEEEGRPQSQRLEWSRCREGTGSHGMASHLPSPVQLVASARKSKKEGRERHPHLNRHRRKEARQGRAEEEAEAPPPARRRGRLERTCARRAIRFDERGEDDHEDNGER
jgi:hypothetical protein